MKAVFFDLDGVIINSEFVVRAAFTLSYKDIVSTGHPPVEQYMKNMGNSFKNIMKKMLLPLEIEESFKKYSRNMIELIPVYKNINELLDFLKKNNIIMCVVTGKDRLRTIEILKTLNIYDYFEVIIAGDDVRNPKPNPEPIDTIIERLKLDKNECIFIGDSPNDIVAARRADIKSCGVSWGFTAKDVLLKEQPDYIVDTPLEIIDLVSLNIKKDEYVLSIDA